LELNEYMSTLGQRYLQLADEEKEILRGLRNQPAGEILQKVFGQEMAPLFSQLAQPKPMTPQESAPEVMANRGALIDTKKKPKGLGARKK
jgi:hypothetical protein